MILIQFFYTLQKTISIILVQSRAVYHEYDLKDYAYLKNIKNYSYYHNYNYQELNSFFDKFIYNTKN